MDLVEESEALWTLYRVTPLPSASPMLPDSHRWPALSPCASSLPQTLSDGPHDHGLKLLELGFKPFPLWVYSVGLLS